MPERPLCRVAVVDFYKMESAPPYLEAAVAILVKFKKPKSGEEILAWHLVGGGKYKIYEFEKVAPQIWNIKFGDCSIEYPNDPNNCLAGLGIGKIITGYWLKQKVRFKIPYKEE
jgi:hypothetical protein